MKKLYYLIALFTCAASHIAPMQYVLRDGLQTKLDQNCPDLEAYLQLDDNEVPKNCAYLDQTTIFLKDSQQSTTLKMIRGAIQQHRSHREYVRNWHKSRDEYERKLKQYHKDLQAPPSCYWHETKTGEVGKKCYYKSIDRPVFTREASPYGFKYYGMGNGITADQVEKAMNIWTSARDQIGNNKAVICDITPEPKTILAKLRYYFYGQPNIAIIIGTKDCRKCKSIQKHFEAKE